MKHESLEKLEEKLRSAGRSLRIPEGLRSEMKLSLMGQLNSQSVTPPKSSLIFIKWAPVVASVVIILSSSTAVLADSAKPGDILYPVDIWVESLSQGLVRDESAKAKLFASIGDERVKELEDLSSVDLSKLSDKRRERLEKARQQALIRSKDGLVTLGTVEEIVQKLYEDSEDEETRDSMLRLSKHLQQVEERRLERLEKLVEWRQWEDDGHRSRQSDEEEKAQKRIRKIFHEAFEDATPEEEDFSPQEESNNENQSSNQSGQGGENDNGSSGNQGSGGDDSGNQGDDADNSGSGSGNDDEEEVEDDD